MKQQNTKAYDAFTYTFIQENESFSDKPCGVESYNSYSINNLLLQYDSFHGLSFLKINDMH